MRPRQTRPFAWPRRWLVTDERMGSGLWSALAHLPRGAGVVFRHHMLPARTRERLGRAVARLCRRRGLCLAVSRDVALARRLGAALVHNPAAPHGLMPHSRPVHDEREAELARLEGATFVFISPMFSTASHPDAVPLSLERAAGLIRKSGRPGIALGGMDEVRFARIRSQGFAGYAGIDCWIRI